MITFSSLLLSTAVFASLVVAKVTGDHQDVRSFPKNSDPRGLPFSKKDLQSHFRAINQQCLNDIVDLYDTSAYATAREAFWVDWVAEDYDCDTNYATATLECSGDAKAIFSHDSVVRACEQVNGLPYLVTFSTTCSLYFDDSSSLLAIFTEYNLPECIPSSCTIAEFDEVALRVAGEKAEGIEEAMLSDPDIESLSSAVCTESVPIGTPVTPVAATTTQAPAPTAPPTTLPPVTTHPPLPTTTMPPVATTQAPITTTGLPDFFDGRFDLSSAKKALSIGIMGIIMIVAMICID